MQLWGNLSKTLLLACACGAFLEASHRISFPGAWMRSTNVDRSFAPPSRTLVASALSAPLSYSSTPAFDDALELHTRLRNFGSSESCDEDSKLCADIQNALDALAQAVRLFGPRGIVTSFNGGKDAVVILHLVRAALARHAVDAAEAQVANFAQGDGPPAHDGNLFASVLAATAIPPRVLYFDAEDDFEEVRTFVKSTARDLHLDMSTFGAGVSFKDGLQKLVKAEPLLAGEETTVSLSNAAAPEQQSVVVQGQRRPLAFVLGTRKADPNSRGQETFAPSSDWMPPFMRVNPVLDWDYGTVWRFLRTFDLPYCSLYDQGYTSLGCVSDTERNPALAVISQQQQEEGEGSAAAEGGGGGGETVAYRPAYELEDYSLERAGRREKTKPKKEEEGNAGSIPAAAKARAEAVGEAAAAEEEGAAPPEFAGVREARTAGLLVVGDEVLRGACDDTNTPILAKALREHGVALEAVAVVGDNAEIIAEEVRSMAARFDVVFTSGGLGPTHDDVTITSLAAALDSPLEPHPVMVDLITRGYFKKRKEPSSSSEPEGGSGGGEGGGGKEELSDAEKKLSFFPRGCWLHMPTPADPSQKPWPVLQCGKVFALPGVPGFFEAKVQAITAEFLGPPRFDRVRSSSSSSSSPPGSPLDGNGPQGGGGGGEPVVVGNSAAARKVTLCVDEASIADLISTTAVNFPNVKVGSYPYYFDASTGQPQCSTVVTFDGSSAVTANGGNNSGGGGSSGGGGTCPVEASAGAAEECRSALVAALQCAGMGEAVVAMEDGDDLPPSKSAV